jgi:LysR family transcriptional activator of glutamate synthase operon
MDLRQLEMFATVAGTSNFTRAGERLHVSHSAISRQVKLLEDELQVALFTRAGKQIFLTDAGKLLLNHVASIFREVTSAVQAVSQRSKKITGRLTLGTGTAILNSFLAPVLREFRNRYPSVTVHVKTGQWPAVIEGVRSGEVDLVVRSLPLPPLARGLSVRRLYREELVVVVEKNHLFATRTVIQPQELNNLQLLSFPYDSATRQILEHSFHKLKISPTVEVELENDDAIVCCVSKGMGVAFLPIGRAVQENLHFVRLADWPIFRTVGLVSLQLRQLSPHLSYFSDLCLEHARSASGSHSLAS